MLTITGYTTTEELYESGHSLIFRGWRNADNLPVIIKLLKGDYPTPEEIVRFKREYEITRNLDIDGVVKVYALEQYQNSLAIILEDFGGESLTKLLTSQSLTLLEFLYLAIQIADIMGAIHQHHIIHKDINPSNIVWHPHTDPSTGPVKIIDFGISTALSRENPEIRNPNVLEGTLAYMSPEQTGRMNRVMDYRTDLYSLGVTYYYLLTGQMPFQTVDPMELVHCHLAKMPLPPYELPGRQNKFCTPKILSDIIMKLMAKMAEDRYQTTFGLKADLQRCLDQLTVTGSIEAFEIGQQDISDRFQIPQKLYGREHEIQTLLQAFDRIANPQSTIDNHQSSIEMVLVTGQAGIGKSALVHEIHKPIVEKHGYFIAGKFDQFKRNIPYSALIQAFQTLVRQLLTEPEEQITQWKEQLLNALGSNGQVIIEMIPEVELIIGPQPELPELPPDKAQNRFHLTFRNFVWTFAAADHPLAIFLDGVQWADSPSLKLIELFMTDIVTPYMLIVCTYHDDEVNDPHPLLAMLAEIQKTGAAVSTMLLKPLDFTVVNQLIADTVKCDLQDVQSLAEVSLQKTNGNPFFLTQFLRSLDEQGMLEFDKQQGAWTWDLDLIRKTAMTDNVVELMAGKIQKLPEATQNVLKLAACIGNQFELETLAAVNERTEPETADDLWNALQEGLIVPVGDAYTLVAEEIPPDPPLPKGE